VPGNAFPLGSDMLIFQSLSLKCLNSADLAAAVMGTVAPAEDARDVCRRHGQLTAQPGFCKSDKRITGSNPLYSASIASDRGGNEREVLVSKQSGVIKRGFKVGMDVKRFQDIWLTTWGFQSNFTFDPVL